MKIETMYSMYLTPRISKADQKVLLSLSAELQNRGWILSEDLVHLLLCKFRTPTMRDERLGKIIGCNCSSIQSYFETLVILDLLKKNQSLSSIASEQFFIPDQIEAIIEETLRQFITD